jgi:outer membrane protein OmpA-like peptidoglycan-associated protein
MNKNVKIALMIGGILLLGGVGYLLYKRYKDRSQCEKKGGKWDAKTKTCKIEAPSQFQEVIAKAYDNLNFKTGSATITNSSFKFLDDIAEYMKANPAFSLSIVGHTDNVGSDEYNQKLSEDRAEAVKSYLIKKGIGEISITAEGKGESEPISNNDTPEGREKNRRVVFSVTKVEELPATTPPTA